MRRDPALLWQEFQTSFGRALGAADEARISDAWCSSGSRTSFYADELMQAVAHDLTLEFSREWLTVDYAMWSRPIDGGQRTPIVLVESENVPSGADHEVRKLCSLSAPLRVLITVAQWEDEAPRWKSKGQRTVLSQHWHAIREAYAASWPDAGIVGVVVGEWGPPDDDTLRFYAFELSTASPPYPEQPLLARPMGHQPRPASAA